MLNQSGQAFSVFKLLIAAVVAVVILTLLLSIINQINIFGQGKPQEEAQKIVNNLSTTKGVVDISGKVVFEAGTSISDRGIAEATRGTLGPEQVCVLPGDFLEEVDAGLFQYNSPGHSVIYRGTSARSAQIAAICDTGLAMAQSEYFEQYTGYTGEPDSDGISYDWVDGECGCIASRQTCCVVALKRFRT